ncbi:MAG TPA: hypothetical protein VFS82_02835 [Lysobacter sp.]|nr:hypothetical protein [Lysobacter sp.]
MALLLQQISAPYTANVFGVSANASLLHLHYGLLLAIAMLERDRWVLAGAYGLVLIGWLARAVSSGYHMGLWLPLGILMHSLYWAWTVLCAGWMGWPKPQGHVRVTKRDLAGFAGIGLLIFSRRGRRHCAAPKLAPGQSRAGRWCHPGSVRQVLRRRRTDLSTGDGLV